jgi:hypothetical protein
MEHLQSGQWQSAWSGPLVNKDGPLSAVVSSKGWAATFDNWHASGYGDDAVVIYDTRGRKVRALSLADILPKAYVHALPRSASSIWWGQGHRFSDDGEALILRVVVPPDPETDVFLKAPDHVEISLRAASGEVMPPQGAAWQQAWQAAQRADAKLSALEAKAYAEFQAPLVAPQGSDKAAWYQYLREAFARVDPDGDRLMAQTFVLELANREDDERALSSLSRALIGPHLSYATDGPNPIVLGSSDPDLLIRAVGKIVESMQPQSLKNVRVYVAVPPRLNEAAATALAPTGATFVPLDIGAAIPQRAERLKRYFGELPQVDGVSAGR